MSRSKGRDEKTIESTLQGEMGAEGVVSHLDRPKDCEPDVDDLDVKLDGQDSRSTTMWRPSPFDEDEEVQERRPSVVEEAEAVADAVEAPD